MSAVATIRAPAGNRGPGPKSGPMFDLLLRGGTVIDGSGAARRRADVALREGRVAAVGDVPAADAEQVLDVGDLVVAPGFIDAHSHADAALLRDPAGAPKVLQGVTTEIVNNCGFGLFPVRSQAAREAMGGVWTEGESPTFASAEEYHAALRARGTAVNVASLVAHGAVRASVVGAEDRPATGDELRAMCDLVREGFRQGAVGVSFGLLYAPGCFATSDEIAAIGRTAAEFGRLLAFHVRNECDRFEESILEVIEIGRETGAHVHVSHIKVADPARWGDIGLVLRHIEEARARGQRVTCDQYPYPAGSSPFTTLLPPWTLEGGPARTLARLRDEAERARIRAALAGAETIPGWDNLSSRIGWDRCMVGSAPGREEWEGNTIADLAARAGRPPEEVLFDLLLATRGAAIGIWHQMCEEDVQTAMRHPAQMVGSDGLDTPGRPHPRLWGTFPRVLGRYVRELGVLTLEQAVHKMTGKTAATFDLAERGLIKPGYRADICVFDPDRVTDRATWEAPTRPPEGIVHVICNGVFTLRDGRQTEARPGQ